MLSPAQMGQAVQGRPYSATEVRHSLQVLGDGTRIEHTETVQHYRDMEGRKRTEQQMSDVSVVTVADPTAGYVLTWNTADKTAHRMPMPKLAEVGALNKATAEVTAAAAGKAGMIAGSAGATFRTTRSIGFSATGADGELQAQSIMVMRGADSGKPPAAEDLGTQYLNGVNAQGTRSTLTIPVGQVGNDREMKVVNERWYSADLQMTVKSVNSDPRFGETSVEMTNINQSAPDSSLFLIPPGYTVQEPQVIDVKGKFAK